MLVSAGPGFIGHCFRLVARFLGKYRAHGNRCIIGDIGHKWYVLLRIEKGEKGGARRVNT